MTDNGGPWQCRMTVSPWARWVESSAMRDRRMAPADKIDTHTTSAQNECAEACCQRAACIALDAKDILTPPVYFISDSLYKIFRSAPD